VEGSRGYRRLPDPIGPADTIRLVTLDYLLAGGDGYAMFAAGANASEPGDALLDVAIAYVKANAPVGAPVQGRIVGP
jgi:2',3'-cyclic-nucleotide 2'-phosphodiesterase (5'-nucleotidase family)